MKLSLFEENKSILLVGEGNFSFAVTLVKQKLNINLTATCYESNVQESGKKNIDILKSYGVRVLSGVDATKLEEHTILQFELFDIVVFNFPHVGGKMRIEKNRDLLKRFFTSVKNVLKHNGKVLVTLCDGQGGTSFDKNNRKWNDSWQVTEMAAHGNFILVDTELFDSSLFQTYTVTGYRSLEKQFNTKDAITHIFILAEEPSIDNIAPKQKIDLESYYDIYNEYRSLKSFISESNIFHNLEGDVNSLPLCAKSYNFDITFTISPRFHHLKLYETLYNYAGLIIDDIIFVDSYKSNQKETKTFRIIYLSKKFPLHKKLLIDIHQDLIADIIEKNLNVSVSR